MTEIFRCKKQKHFVSIALLSFSLHLLLRYYYAIKTKIKSLQSYHDRGELGYWYGHL